MRIPEVMRYIRPVRNRPETDQFFAEVIQYSKDNPAYGRMAAIEKKSGAFVGSFAIIPLEKTEHMQLGYSLLPNYWGKGYATELVKAGLEYIFTLTNLDEIFGVTESSNTASQHVLLKSGFNRHSTVMEGEKELFRFIFLKKIFSLKFRQHELSCGWLKIFCHKRKLNSRGFNLPPNNLDS